MQTISKIIIGILITISIVLGGGWAYSAGHITGLSVFQNNNELEAKQSSFWASYIKRFDFEGIGFVQNIEMAIPIPQKVLNGRNYLIGTLTFKHNGTRSKILYVDTPTRVEIKNEQGIFYYTSQLLDNNLTRHKFLVIPNTEYNIEYQINDINEFIDFSGDVSFKLRNSAENKDINVVTRFISPLSNYPTNKISLGEYDFTNTGSTSLNGTFDGEYEITLRERGGGWFFTVPGSLSLYDDGTNIRVYHWKAPSNNVYLQTNRAVSGKNVKIKINKTSIKIADAVYNNLWQITPQGKKFYFGGNSDNTLVRLTPAKDNLGSILYYRGTSLCAPLGYPGGGSYGINYNSYVYYYDINDNPIRYKHSGYNRHYLLSYVDCRPRFSNSREIHLSNGYMEYPYLLDSSRTIVIPEVLGEVKIDYGDIIKTIDTTIANNKTTIVIPDDVDLIEFEPSKLSLIVGNKIKNLNYYYDPLKKNIELWDLFETQFAEVINTQ